MYAKDHIKDSYNLPYNNIKKMSINELNKWFSEILKLHYNKLNNLVNANKLQIYEIPIICYCAHNKCTAGYNAAIELLKKQFVNVLDYKDGMKEYLKIK